MIQGIEMGCVVITLLAFLNPPINCVPMGVILRNRRWGSMDELLNSSVEGEGGGVIGRYRIGRQKTYCQMSGKDAASNERRDGTLHSTGRVISPIRLALPNREGAMLLLLYASDIFQFRDTNC